MHRASDPVSGRLGNSYGRNECYGKHLRTQAQEEELLEKETQLSLITDITPIGLTHCSRDRRYLFVNRAYAQLFDRTPVEIMGRPIVEIMGNEAYATILPHVERVLCGETIEYEKDVPFDGAGPRFLRVAYRPQKNGLGEVLGWFASLTDITESKRAEAALLEKVMQLHASDRRLAEIFHGMTEAFFTLDREWRFTLVNDRGQRLFRHRRD